MGSRWYLCPLPPVVYYRYRPTSGSAAAAADARHTSDREQQTTSRSTGTSRKRKRPVTLLLPGTVGRDFIIRGSISCCSQCNSVGPKKKEGRQVPAPASGAKREGRSYCERCRTILKCGRFLSREMIRFDLSENEATNIRMEIVSEKLLSAKAIYMSVDRKGTREAEFDINEIFDKGSATNIEKEMVMGNGDAISFRLNIEHYNGKPSAVGASANMILSVLCLRFIVSSATHNAGLEETENAQIQRKSDRGDVDLFKGGISGSASTMTHEIEEKQHDEENSPVLSMHHFSASQWQNEQSADIAFSDTSVALHDGEPSGDWLVSSSQGLGQTKDVCSDSEEPWPSRAEYSVTSCSKDNLSVGPLSENKNGGGDSERVLSMSSLTHDELKGLRVAAEDCSGDRSNVIDWQRQLSQCFRCALLSMAEEALSRPTCTGNNLDEPLRLPSLLSETRIVNYKRKRQK